MISGNYTVIISVKGDWIVKVVHLLILMLLTITIALGIYGQSLAYYVSEQ